MRKVIILAIETSCDETGLALVEASGGLKSPRFKILKNLIASQIKVHQPFGGVVPNLAKREHLKNLPILFEQIFENSKSEARNPKQIRKSKLQSKSGKIHATGYMLHGLDLIAVTVGPGLEPALWTGIGFAKQLYSSLIRADLRADKRGLIKSKRKKPQLIGANHLEGHLYSFLLPSQSKTYNLKSKTLFPAVALIVSGGHTILLLVKDLKTWKIIGETRDDAVGEAFDKVARMLKLPYPGGPEIQKIARKGRVNAIEFPRPMIYEKNYDFSFSGLKTSVLYYLRSLGAYKNTKKYESMKADIAASFQQAAVEVLVKKTLRAVKEFDANSIILSGGVAANKKLRSELRQEILRQSSGQARKQINFLVADQKYNTDNAVMIAVAGYMTYLRKKKYPMKANGNLGI